MQVLAHNPEIQSYANEEGHFITGFLIGTKPNEARWRISKRTGHEMVQKFIGRDFAIIPELIKTPLSQGGGGHYFGQDTKEDLLKGYAEHSHGKYVRVKGPYSYNDGSDDYYYNFDVKLRDSKAAAALQQHGADTWVPFSHSPHIWPLAGPDDDIYDWEPIGGALVIKGAYGPQAVISKLCKGTAAQCEKSLGAATNKEIIHEMDTEIADFISSLVSKSASSQHIMTENKEISAPVVTNLTAEVAKPNTTVDSQTAITNAQLTRVVTAEEFQASEKEKAELKKQVTQLLNDKRNTELTNALIDFAGVTDEKRKAAFIEKWFKKEVDITILREFYNDIKTEIAERRKRASEAGEEEKEEEKEEGEKPTTATAKKSKGASLPPEPSLPKAETESSRTASIPVNKAKVIGNFMVGGS